MPEPTVEALAERLRDAINPYWSAQITKTQWNELSGRIARFVLAERQAVWEAAARLVEGETCSDEKTCKCFSCPMLNQIAAALRARAQEEKP